MTKNSAENQVAERRLRPIYDWLDNGNNKKALQEADKVLKKQPNFQCCKVLKCLALIRLGKELDAEIILNKVLEEVPVDEGALQAMTIAWRELQQPEKICTMYEGAVKKEPLNEEFLSHLFMSYVRMGEYKKQQMVAMNLYKAAHKNPYYYWSVMSLVLQSLEGDEKLGKTVHLPLALRMLQKMEKEGKVEQEQEILLFCLVLEMKEDWEAGVALLQGPLGQKLAKSGSYKTFVHCKNVEWQMKCEGWEEVRRLSREELDKMPDQWIAWQNFITASKHLHKQNSDENIIKDVEEYVKSKQSDHPEMRGVWLAEMEFVSDLGNRDDLPELILQYFSKFNTKLVTYSDIVKYLDVLDDDKRKEIFQKIVASVQGEDITSQADICRDVIVCQLNRYCGNHENLSVEDLLKEVEILVEKYQSVQPLVEDMVSTDLRPSDEYLVLVSHLLWDIWHQTMEDKFYLQAVVFLHWALSKSPSNWQLKLMMIRMMISSGCGGYAHEVHSSLDIKHLMLDSLGWVMAHQLVQCGHLALATQHHLMTMKLYTQVNKDTSDHIITAYRTGTFYQIRDIYKLRRRITTSYNLMSTNTESHLYILLHRTSSHSSALSMMIYLDNFEDKDWDQKQDNRDLDTMVSWDPASSRDPDMRKSTMRTELLYSRTRQLILKCVQTSARISEEGSDILGMVNNGDVVENSLLEDYLEKLKAHWKETCEESDAMKPKRPVPQSPATPNLTSYKSSKQVETLVKITDIVQRMIKDEDNIDMSDVVNVTNDLEERLSSLSDQVNTHSLHLYHRRELLESIMWHLETIGLSCILFGVIVTLMKGAGAGAGGGKGAKKGKKGKGAVIQKYSDFVENVNSAIEKFHQADKKLEDIVNVFEANLSLATLAESLQELKFSEDALFKKDDFLKSETEAILSKMETSFKESFSQIKEALKHKQEYLNSIKL